MAKGRMTVTKKDQYQKTSQKDREETAKEIVPETVPETDQEFGSEYPYHTPESGMNKRKQQQKK